MSEPAGLQSTISTLQIQNAALRQLVVIHDRLGALVLQGADVSAITRMMADLVGRRILLLDALLQVVAMAVPAGFSVDGFEWAPGQEYVRAVLATQELVAVTASTKAVHLHPALRAEQDLVKNVVKLARDPAALRDRGSPRLLVARVL